MNLPLTIPGLGPGFPAGTTEKLPFVAVHIGTRRMVHARETVLEAAQAMPKHPEGAPCTSCCSSGVASMAKAISR
jgi:hypothetical protein